MTAVPPLRSISPSQVKTFEACARKWAWEKIHGIRSPSKPSAELGTRVHEILEAWLTDGTPPDLAEEFTYSHPHSPTETITKYPGRIAREGLHLLPAPGTVVVEGDMHIPRSVSPHGPYFGRLDGHLIEPDGVPLVIDHKTTSSSRWALTEETLPEDVQAVMYAAWAFGKARTDRARLRWVYYSTAKPRAWAVEVEVTRGQITPTLDRIDRKAGQMWALHRAARERGLRAPDIPPTPSACSDYGGCPHRERCGLTPAQTLEALMSEQTPGPSPLDGLLASLGEGATPTAVGDLPPPPPPPGPGGPAVDGDTFVAALGAPPDLPPPPVIDVPPAPPAPGPINPPEAPDGRDPVTPTPRPAKPPAQAVHRPGPDADRAIVKAYAVQIGAVDASSRLGLPKIWEAIQAAETRAEGQANGGAGNLPHLAPAPPPAAPRLATPPPPPDDPAAADVEIPQPPPAAPMRRPTEVVPPPAAPDYPDPVIVAGRRLAEAFMDFLAALRGGAE